MTVTTEVDGLSGLSAELRQWLTDNWDPDRSLRDWWQRLADSGWAFAHYPKAWFGRGLSPAVAGVISYALRDFGAVPGPGGFATGLAAPTLLDHGTDDQKARHLPGMVAGTDAFCQLFSEPNAGSDLAGLQCRAERDGDTWVVNGQKVWTSSAQIANKAMLVARTNADVPKHAGISYFFIDVRQPGVEIRPLREMTGRSLFNEVFLTDARIPAADLIGGEGNGWAVANTTLAYERRLSSGGVSSWASPGPIAGDLDRPAGGFAQPSDAAPAFPPPQNALRLANIAKQLGRGVDPCTRIGLVRLYTLERLADMTGQRARALAECGLGLPGLPQLTKMAGNHHTRLARQVVFDVLKEIGTLFAYHPDGVAEIEAMTGIDGLGEIIESAIFAAAPPIYGGSDQIQRNILGERALGLPREPGDDRNTPFKTLHGFGVRQLTEAFPAASAIATAAVVAKATLEGSPPFIDDFWTARFPGQIPEPQVFPEVLDGDTFALEGHLLQVIDTGFTDTECSTALWAPDLRLVVAGDAAYNGIHQYTAETTAESRQEWMGATDLLAALDPVFVVAGHKNPDLPDAPKILADTKKYLADFNRLDAETETASELYEAMLALYPKRANPGALWAGAKTAKGSGQ
jgi:alkylation response protein AidB-like acyl-CoA dehydrogenase/glyoxylase-like metal-dependent hydrolase (beta-lactamase superfamily II)